MPGLYNRFDSRKGLSAPYQHYYSVQANPSDSPPPPETLGLPVWFFHPFEAAKCWVNFVITEIEDYSIMPLTLIGGGLIIYYLRKTPSF